MATKLTVKRLDLIKATEKKAKANQDAHDKAVAEQNESPLVALFDKLLDEKAKQDMDYINPSTGLTKNGLRYNFATYILQPFGLSRKTAIPEPRLFEKELSILKLATDAELSIEDTSDYFSFLKA